MNEVKSESKNANSQGLPEKFAKWKGIDRTLIEWHPIIDLNKCTGCGMCVTSCGRKVFDYNYETHKSEVKRPYQCMVGCTSCRVWCVYDAISFPDVQRVRDFINEHKLVQKATKAIKEAKNKQ